MEFFLDVDGIILDFEYSFLQMLRENYDANIPLDFTPTSWDLKVDFPHLDVDHAWNAFINSDRIGQLPALISAEELNAISANYLLYLVTNIPSHLYKKREANLAYYGFKYTKLFLAGTYNFGEKNYFKKSKIIQQTATKGSKIVFLDDHPDNCLDVYQALPESLIFLMTRPHNKNIHPEHSIRVDSWGEFIQRSLFFNK